MSPTGSSSSSSSSSRWSPTTEQLMILEELYRTGFRTPSASQIQQITTHLSFYGRIEGKNVFYWFQNHKARDRQKLRRKLNKQLQLQQQLQFQHYQPNHHDISNNNFVANFGYPYASSTTNISLFNSSSLFFQGGDANIAEKGMNCKWDVFNPQCIMEKKDVTFCNNYGWTLMDANNQQSSCCTKPLKTLDLFPLTTTRIKEDCTTKPHQTSSCDI